MAFGLMRLLLAGMVCTGSNRRGECSGIPLLAALASPFAERRGGVMACIVFLWIPASAGMTGRFAGMTG